LNYLRLIRRSNIARVYALHVMTSPVLLRRPGWWQRVALAAAMLLAASCTAVRFVADYDEQLDQGATAFQKRIEKHLLVLERNLGTPVAAYPAFGEFYTDATVDLAVLHTRAAATPHNEITVQQIELLQKNLQLLERMHREGLTASDLPPLHVAFGTACAAIIKFELAKKRGEPPAS
jgi:hypothetical protein